MIFRGRDAFLLGLMCEHRAGDDVADGVDAGDIGAQMRVDDNAAAIVPLDAGRVETEAVGKRHAPDRHQHAVGFDRLRRPAGCGLDLHLERFAGGVDAGDLRCELEGDALLLQHPVELPRHLAVDAGQDVIEKFDDHHLGAEPPPHRAELEPDDAGADDEQLLRHFGEVERPGRGHHALFIDVDAVEAGDVRAGSDDDVLRLQRLRLAVGGFHLDLARRDDLSRAVKRLDLVLLEQKVDALDVAVDVLLLVFQQCGADRRSPCRP